MRSYRGALTDYRKFLLANNSTLDPIFGEYRRLRQAIEAWVWEATQRVKERTMANKLAAVSSFYEYLYQFMIIDRNPAHRVRVTKLDAPPVIAIPSSEDVDALIAHVKAHTEDVGGLRDELVLRFLREGGFRISELCGIVVKDVDFNGRVHIRIGKGNTSRITAVLPETAQDALRFARRFELADVEPLFMSIRYYKPPWDARRRMQKTSAARPLGGKGVSHMLKRRAIAAGFDAEKVAMLGHAHSYRHVWAIDHVKDGTNTIVLMRMGGWRDAKMIDYYIGAAAIDVHAVRR